MRHLLGVVLAIVLAAAIFFAALWGYLKLLIGPARVGALPAGGGFLLHDHAVLEGFGVLLATGLLAGILIAAPRISPLASELPGLVLLAWTGLYLFSVRHAACGPVHPAEDADLRRRLRSHALRRGAGPGGPDDDHPAVRAVQVAACARRHRPARALRPRSLS
jgi:hypothetical protein